MNRARVAVLLHELVDAIFDDVADLPADRPSRPRRRARTLKMPVRPAVEVDDLAKARAERALRQKGLVPR